MKENRWAEMFIIAVPEYIRLCEILLLLVLPRKIHDSVENVAWLENLG